ncbi:putative transposase element L1Md-A101/L1Md-A102/L1Md-A2 [Labeo rohita]|uniref:Putative transposase element L1Md-A101/L1Md-A102/L1Md-A2 n=1 Tax=Labeo rohita TaxID=84645 RepID=A0A498LAZ4_LABRO|nr:putative transposase element L1Md-A101/L1Md-A102/L1Md-A2 [Labeo rohita]
METRARQKKTPGRQDKIEVDKEMGETEPTASRHANAEGEIGLEKILEELREFRKENNEKLADIKEDLNNTNKRIEEAENRITEAEEQIQQTGEALVELLKLQTQLESKLTDQEGRSRRDNIYGVPEGSENGSSTITFIEKLLKDGLDLDPSTELQIQRAHRALAPKPTDSARPRSIVVKFLSFKTKEDILGQVWRKGGLKWNNSRITCDHDYPPEVLKKRKEYAQVNTALKEKKIRFQTPYPAKLRVFYEGETMLYNSAEEATKDMKARGLQVDVIRPQQTLLERLQHRTWTTKRGRGTPGETTSAPEYVERLKSFRRK